MLWSRCRERQLEAENCTGLANGSRACPNRHSRSGHRVDRKVEQTSNLVRQSVPTVLDDRVATTPHQGAIVLGQCETQLREKLIVAVRGVDEGLVRVKLPEPRRHGRKAECQVLLQLDRVAGGN